MPTDKPEKTPVDKVKDIISQLKQMEHYSRSNMEKLTEHYLFFDDELKHKEFVARWGDLINAQNAFEDQVKTVIDECQNYCNKKESES